MTRAASRVRSSASTLPSCFPRLTSRAMLATDWSKMGDVPDDLVRNVYAISGVFELQPLVSTSLNAALRLDAALFLDPLAGAFLPRHGHGFILRLHAAHAGGVEPGVGLRGHRDAGQ